MDKFDRLINRVTSMVDLMCTFVMLYVVLMLAGEIGNMLAFMKTWQGGW